jgi:hypothetical protein
MEVSGQLHALTVLPPRERASGTHWIVEWVGPRAVLDAVVKRKIPFNVRSNLHCCTLFSLICNFGRRHRKCWPSLSYTNIRMFHLILSSMNLAAEKASLNKPTNEEKTRDSSVSI